jgi:hypothetical protein
LTIDFPSNAGWPRNAKQTTDVPHRAAFDVSMSRHRRLGFVPRVPPNVMAAAVMIEHAALGPKMAFEINTVHCDTPSAAPQP